MAKRPKDSGFPDFVLEAILLSRVDALHLPPPEEPSDEEASLFAVGSMSAVERDEKAGRYYTNVCFKCGRDGGKDQTSVELIAMYSILFSADTKDPEVAEKVGKAVAQSAGWSQFVSLFHLVNGQMRARMPVLPFTSGDLDMRTIEELTAEFDQFEKRANGTSLE